MLASPTRRIVAYLVLAFGPAWAAMFGAGLAGWDLVDPLVQFGFAFTPALAAVLVRWWGGEGFADAGLRPRLRTAWPWYLIAWLGPYALTAGALAAAAAVGWWPDPAALDTVVSGVPGPLLLAVLLVVVPLLAPIYWGEEFGWTSYLRLRLLADRPVLAPLVVGTIWAVWHFPLAFLGYISFQNVAVGLTLWTVSFCAQEVVLSWLRLRSGSIWTTSVAHGGYNMVFSLLTGAVLTAPEDVDVTTAALPLVQLAPLAVVATVILGVDGRRRRVSRRTGAAAPPASPTGR